MPTVELEPETEQRLTECARKQGVSEAALLRLSIEDSLDDLDDIQMATERLSNPMPSLSSAEARVAVDLDH